MKKLLRYTVALAVVVFCSTVYSPPVQAVGTYSVLTDYYDSGLNAVGWKYHACSGSLTSSGTLDGEWKEVSGTKCSFPWDDYDEYWHKCSGGWVQVGYLGDPSC
ncbi:MAG TPA: hypothetical protein VJ276_14615 [Thermoanaerobaculia bacterium]|nr:hypothetical protein [Thermoanaerobaculia bacterium]